MSILELTACGLHGSLMIATGSVQTTVYCVGSCPSGIRSVVSQSQSTFLVSTPYWRPSYISFNFAPTATVKVYKQTDGIKLDLMMMTLLVADADVLGPDGERSAAHCSDKQATSHNKARQAWSSLQDQTASEMMQRKTGSWIVHSFFVVCCYGFDRCSFFCVPPVLLLLARVKESLRFSVPTFDS